MCMSEPWTIENKSLLWINSLVTSTFFCDNRCNITLTWLSFLSVIVFYRLISGIFLIPYCIDDWLDGMFYNDILNFIHLVILPLSSISTSTWPNHLNCITNLINMIFKHIAKHILRLDQERSHTSVHGKDVSGGSLDLTNWLDTSGNIQDPSLSSVPIVTDASQDLIILPFTWRGISDRLFTEDEED
jgi:hypothetical protein